MRVGGRPVALLAGLSVIVAVAACGRPADDVPTPPAPSVGPGRSVTAVVEATRRELVRVLGEQGLTLADTQAAVQPAEAPLLAAAPRVAYQAVLPRDPARGYILVYEFPDPSRAATAAVEEQAFLGSGPGRVLTPQGTITVIRQVGATLVVYSWLPGVARDPSAPAVQLALETLGVGFPVAN